MTVNELIEILKEFHGSEEVMLDVVQEIEDYIEECSITDVIPDVKRNIVKLEYL